MQDVKIPVELRVCCARVDPLAFTGNPYIILLNKCQIIDILTEDQISNLNDLYHIALPGYPLPKTILTYLTFEVTFDSDREIDNVSLNCHDINDILSNEILKQIKAKAKADYIQERIDRGEG